MASSCGSAAFDWQKCVFCQTVVRNEKTSCPADSKRTDAGIGYKTVADVIQGFVQLGQLPASLSPFVGCWDDGNGICDTFARHRALWHIKCKQHFVHGTKLDRLRTCTGDSEPAGDKCEESVDVTFPKIPRLTRGALNAPSTSTESICFFCDAGGSDLRQVLTFAVDEKVRRCANVLGDSMLLGKLAKGDMIAIEAKYHPSCLLSLYYKAGHQCNPSPLDDTMVPYDCDSDSLALAEVISYMEDAVNSETTPVVFKLSELTHLYSTYLLKYKIQQNTKVNSTRFRERLLQNLPNLTAVAHGRDVLLTFSHNIGAALHDMRDRSTSDADAIHLMRTAKMIRREIFSQKHEFDGNLKNDDSSVPSGLLYLVNMILEGVGKTAAVDSVPGLSLAQLIVFNCQKRRKTVDTENIQSVTRHAASRETPLPIYIGLMLYSATRKKKHIDKCHKLGLSVSYDRVLQLTNKTANTLCSQYRDDGVVCPPTLKPGCFTVAAVDNVDHNLSSTSAQSSFHGTAISLTQFDGRNEIDVCTSYSTTASDLASDIVLPLSYTEIEPCILPSRDPMVPRVAVEPKQSCVNDDEYKWLEAVADSFASENVLDNISWSGFHAELNAHTSSTCCFSVLLPLFRQNANTAAMMRQTLSVVQNVLRKVNDGQVPVVAADQPLFALLKQIQWHWPDKFGETKFVILLGGLHTEMATLRMIGHWLCGSGWVQCLVQSGIATAGVAESFLSAAHVKRTRYAHTVTAAALYVNLRQSYLSYCNSLTDGQAQSFDEWRAGCAKCSTQFQYWSTVLDLELLLLSFVRSLRCGNFQLYVECLQKLAPWFFACDHTNYARWLPVHIRDMLSLQESHPGIYEQFMNGNFTASKSHRNFSRIAIDQVHEQLNAAIKGDGGGVGLTENDAALCRWTVTGPEIVRMLEQFEYTFLADTTETKHHEQTSSFENHFKRDVGRMLDILAVEVPFSTTSGNDLITLCANTIADKAVAQTVKSATDIGNKQFETFFKERLSATASMSVLTPLPRNKLPLFLFKSQSNKRGASGLKVSQLKSDCQLFSRLYIACQTRDGNLDDFFRYENQVYPPSLSQGGSLFAGTKSDLLDSLPINKSCESFTESWIHIACAATILDGAVVVQMLRPNSARTFSDYRVNVFVPYLMSVLSKTERVDVVFDVYREHSLKVLTREKRGVGTRSHVVGHAKIPTNWQEFLRVDENKSELFHFLAEADLDESDTQGKTVIFTYNESVRVAAGYVDVSGVECCNHEEADTRIILHSYHAAGSGYNTVKIRTVDTDVVVLAISFFSRLSASELWIHYGVGRSARLIAAHEISASLGPTKCSVFPTFHALTGCDTTSAFYGKGKKTAWLTWEAYPDLTQALLTLSQVTAVVDDETLSVLERFVILLYDRTSECESLDLARKHMFTKKAKTMENIPPTANAFLQHIKRTVYQAVHCWSHSLEAQMPVFDPAEWGWCKDGEKWLPQWMTIPQISQMCQELLHCSCRKACTARCKCVKASLPCTALCQCDGECQRL